MHIHQKRTPKILVILSFVIGLEAYIRANREKGEKQEPRPEECQE